MRMLLIALAFFLGPWVTTAMSQDCPEDVGRWPYGPAETVAASGNLVFLGSGVSLQIVDLTDPATPRLVGEITFPDIVREIELSGGHAFIANRTGGRPCSWLHSWHKPSPHFLRGHVQ